MQGEIKVESNLGTQYDEMWRKKNEEAMEKEFQRELKVRVNIIISAQKTSFYDV